MAKIPLATLVVIFWLQQRLAQNTNFRMPKMALRAVLTVVWRWCLQMTLIYGRVAAAAVLGDAKKSSMLVLTVKECLTKLFQ